MPAATIERNLAHVEDEAGKVLEEDARPHLAFGAIHHDGERDLAERLIGVGIALSSIHDVTRPGDDGENQRRDGAAGTDSRRRP